MERVVCERDDYAISLEDAGGQTFGHMKVMRWGADVLRRIRADVDSIMRERRAPVYTRLEMPDAKWCKFMRAIGFKHFRNFGSVMVFVREAG